MSFSQSSRPAPLANATASVPTRGMRFDYDSRSPNAPVQFAPPPPSEVGTDGNLDVLTAVDEGEDGAMLWYAHEFPNGETSQCTFEQFGELFVEHSVGEETVRPFSLVSELRLIPGTGVFLGSGFHDFRALCAKRTIILA